jgi:hypothetical protein
MYESTPLEPGQHNDDKIVHLTIERLVASLDKPEEVVEQAVRSELERWRASARIQMFVPILAERAARERLTG